MTNLPKVAIVTLNYKNWQDTIECLESLQQIDYPDYRIVVVDNGSNDESVERIKEWARGKLVVNSKYVEYKVDLKPIFFVEYNKEVAEKGGDELSEAKLQNFPAYKKLVIIKLFENLGFSKGNNIGIRYILNNPKFFDYILVINNDVVVHQSFLKKLINECIKIENCGVATPKILFYNDGYTVQYCGADIDWYGVSFFKHLYFKFLRKKRIEEESSRTTPFETEFAMGACMLIKINAIKKVGLFPEELFLEAEDTDISIRMIRNKYKILCVPDAIIWHKGSSSIENIGDLFIEQYFRSRIIVRAKYSNITNFSIFLFLTFGEGLIVSIYKIIYKKSNFYFLLHVFKGFFAGIKEGVKLYIKGFKRL